MEIGTLIVSIVAAIAAIFGVIFQGITRNEQKNAYNFQREKIINLLNKVKASLESRDKNYTGNMPINEMIDYYKEMEVFYKNSFLSKVEQKKLLSAIQLFEDGFNVDFRAGGFNRTHVINGKKILAKMQDLIELIDILEKIKK